MSFLSRNVKMQHLSPKNLDQIKMCFPGEEDETHGRLVSRNHRFSNNWTFGTFSLLNTSLRDCVHSNLTYGNVDKQQAFIQLVCPVYIAEHTYVIFSLRQSGNATKKFLQPVIATASIHRELSNPRLRFWENTLKNFWIKQVLSK